MFVVDPFPGISHGDLLELILSLAVLLGAARLLGELARRLRQPAVVGEILAGVLLGPSVLSRIFPQFGNLILPQTELQSQLLDVVALLGILFLMITVGLETDLALIRSRWRTAAGVGFGGLVLPFALGFLAGSLFPASLLVDERRVVFSLFLAVALALSAIPVLAKILTDLGLLRREFGQTTLAAGMIDDIFGWVLLGMVISLASAGGLSPGAAIGTVGAVVLFIVASIVVARPLVTRGLDFVVDRFESRDMPLTLIVVLAFGWGAFSQALHLEPILGAFTIGILFGQQRRVPVETVRRLESVTNGVFAPIFLATAGLRLRIDQLLEPRLLLITAALFVVAAVGKLAGGYLGARLIARTSTRDAWGYGIALNARGVLGIVVATIGLSMGIFGVEVYSMVVVISVLTSLLAPIGLRAVFPAESVDPAAEEDERRVFGRVLMPVRIREAGGGDVRALEAAALSALTSESSQVTSLAVVPSTQRHAADRYLQEVSAMFTGGQELRRRVVKGAPARAILDEAAKDYDLIALGAPEPGPDGDFLFGPVIDEVIRFAPCPTLVFTARGGQWPPQTIMVPTGGSASAARAADLAYSLAGPGSTVLLFHVVDPEMGTEMAVGRSSSAAVRMEIGQDIVSDLRRAGEKAGVSVVSEVVMGGAMTSNIVDRARQSVDLIVLGTSVRVGTQRLFLGPKVERLLRETPCSVMMLNT